MSSTQLSRPCDRIIRLSQILYFAIKVNAHYLIFQTSVHICKQRNSEEKSEVITKHIIM